MAGLKATDAPVLWAGVLAGPAAWAAQLTAVYALAPWACASAGRAPLHVVSALGLLAAVGGGVVAGWAWRSVGGWPSADDEAAAGRVRLMTVLGLLTGTLFTVIILAQWVAVMILPLCPT